MRYFDRFQRNKNKHRFTPSDNYLKSLYLQSDTWRRCQDFLDYWAESLPHEVTEISAIARNINTSMASSDTCWETMLFATEAFTTQEPQEALRLAASCGATYLNEITLASVRPKCLTEEGACFLHVMRQVLFGEMGEIHVNHLRIGMAAMDIRDLVKFTKTVLYIDPTLDRLCLYAEHDTLKLVYVLTSPAEYSDDYFSINTGHITDDTPISKRA